MKVVTLYKHKTEGLCAYKYKGKVYPFGRGSHNRETAKYVVTRFYLDTPCPELYEYTGERYTFK